MPSHSIVKKNNSGMHIMVTLLPHIPEVVKKVHQVNSHQKINLKSLHQKISPYNNKK